MGIINDIKQTKPFKSKKEEVLVNILYTQSWLTSKQKSHFNKFDITSKQYNILRILKGHNSPMTTLEIRDRMIDKMSDASRITDRMEKKGLVIKNVCSEDQRRVDITLSEKGSKLLIQLNEETDRRMSDLVHLTEEEASQLSVLLDKLRG